MTAFAATWKNCMPSSRILREDEHELLNRIHVAPNRLENYLSEYKLITRFIQALNGSIRYITGFYRDANRSATL